MPIVSFNLNDADIMLMPNEVCEDNARKQEIKFPAIRVGRIGFLVGVDTFTATVSRQRSTGALRTSMECRNYLDGL